jgi:hypothetical protein
MRKVRPDIKPCPYTTCGHQAVLIGGGEENDSTLYWVECEGCCANGPYSDDADAAIASWNEIQRNEPKKIPEPLKPCPMCGMEASFRREEVWYRVICKTCRTQAALAVDTEAAARAWNRRPEDKQ